MAGIQLTGLATGFDWKSVVDQLMIINKVPQDRLSSEKTIVDSRTNAVNEIKTAMLDFQTAAKALASTDTLLKRSASLLDTNSTWTASAAPNTAAGSYVVQVLQLATRARLEGIGNVGSALSSTADVSGVMIAGIRTAPAVTTGDFTINGAKISVASTDSLQDVFSKIGTATGGAVSASYDPTTDRVNLASAAPMTLGSSNDTSNILTALKLYNNGTGAVISGSALGSTRLSGTIGASGLAAVTAVDGTGAGAFKINGVEIGFNVNNDSIQSVLTRINDSAAGVTASYDAAQDRFLLTNRNTGDTGIFVEEAPGGLLSSMGLGGASLVRGKNAEFTVNGGGTLVSQSNTFDETIHGVTGLSVTATSESTQMVNVSADKTDTRAKIEEFIKKYNSAMTLIDKYTKVTTSGTKVTSGLLSNYREIGAMAQSMRNLLFSSTAVTGSIQRLNSMGIDFKGTENQLEIKDSAALDRALTEKTKDAASFFSDKANGFVARLDAILEKQVGTNGTLPTQAGNLQKQSKSIEKQIADMQRRLDQQRSTLEANFIRMEQAQATIQQQSQMLAKTFSSSSSNS